MAAVIACKPYCYDALHSLTPMRMPRRGQNFSAPRTLADLLSDPTELQTWQAFLLSHARKAHLICWHCSPALCRVYPKISILKVSTYHWNSVPIYLRNILVGGQMRDCNLQVPGPGQLFKALSVFALRDVDMTKIESRPVREGSSRQFDYLFYVDLVGGMGEHVIQNALRQLQVCLWPIFHVCGEILKKPF